MAPCRAPCCQLIILTTTLPCLLQVLVSQIAFPLDYTEAEGWGSVTYNPLFDAEEFLTFRAVTFNTLHETLVAIYQLLRQDYLACLTRIMSEPGLSWQRLEACLFCLLAVFREIRTELEGNDAVTVAQLPTIVTLLHQLVKLPAIGTPAPLIATALSVLGKAATVIHAGAAVMPTDFMPSLIALLNGTLARNVKSAAEVAAAAAASTGSDDDDDDDDDPVTDTAFAAAFAIASICKACWAELVALETVQLFMKTLEVVAVLLLLFALLHVTA